jgi:hypothetical protein
LPTSRFILGAFEKFQKATISSATSVRLFGRMEQLGYYWTDFQEDLYQYFSKI